MEPVTLETEDVVMLPPHDLVVFAKDQPQYRPLPAARLHGPEGRLVTRWTFTPEERARVAAGEDLFLEVLTFGRALQPLLPTVGLREMCPADPPAPERHDNGGHDGTEKADGR